ncbi:TadE/TadG family type IV pilus assembly protein [Rhizobium tubonense]|nr:pilus assembly protein TadG-related protein [Rhizobium tubonense]
MWSLWQRFCSDRDGNFGIMTALVMVPLIGAAGLAVDVSNAVSIRNELYSSADAAAAGSLAEKSPGMAAAMIMPSDGSVSLAQADAKQLFFGQEQDDGSLQDVAVNVNIDVTKTANTVKSNVTFTATIPTTFMRILGQDTITVSGNASAQNQLATYIDFYMLLDNTPSMGVGATPKDVAKMESNTSDSCAFACHQMDTSNNYYALAKSLGVTLRIDVVREATKSLTTTAVNTRTAADQYRMAVYTFGAAAEKAGLTMVSALTSDMAQVSQYTDAVDLMTTPKQNYNNDEQTDFDNTLTQLSASIPTPGNGTSSLDPEKVVFFVTDGVGDSNKPNTCTEPTTGGRCQEPIDTSFCQPLKNRGIKIAVLYTTYLPLPNNAWYQQWIAPFQSQIATRMQSCASPGYYFEVSPTEGISDAMNALFLRILQNPRLTN